MKQGLISIIMPAYNAGRYLAESIESILSQSYTDWELLLIDDGSEDNTLEIFNRYAARDSRIKVFHKENGGISSARNYGLDRIEGEYVTFLDSDDLMHPEFIAKTKRALEHSEASIALGHLDYFDGEWDKGKEIFAKEDATFTREEDAIEVIEQTLYQTRHDNCVHSKLYDSRIWEHIRFTEGLWYEDLDIFYRLWPMSDKIIYVGDALIGYRQHPESFMHKFTKGRLDSLKVVDAMKDWIGRYYPELNKAVRVRRFAAYANIYKLCIINGIRKYKDIMQLCKGPIKEERRYALRDKQARKKDRLGALVSYLLIW